VRSEAELIVGRYRTCPFNNNKCDRRAFVKGAATERRSRLTQNG